MNTAANRLATGGRNNIGAPGVLLGTARLLTCIAEVPAFRMSGKILQALGVSGSFALAQAAYIMRFLWYVNLDKIAKLGPWGIWAVLPIELLHGITFAVNWSALTTHSTRVASTNRAGSTCSKPSGGACKAALRPTSTPDGLSGICGDTAQEAATTAEERSSGCIIHC